MATQNNHRASRHFQLSVFSFQLFMLLALSANAQVPEGYYNTAFNKKQASLKTAMKDIINHHTTLSYNSLLDHFKKTDNKGNNIVWDMYSDENSLGYTFSYNSNASCGNYGKEGDCYNREHSMPKSWFNNESPMYSDLFHLYPTDGYVNGRRSNYPFGEVGSATWTSSNGSKVGNSNFPGYSGTVFEPVDLYKGDFARTYFYMVTCYEDKVSSWNSPMLSGNKYPAFTNWAQNLLLKWSRNDLVSPKEINRNNEAYKIQGNRNPFIDFPQLAEYIWGDSITYAFNPGSTPNPDPDPDPNPNPEFIVDFGGPWNNLPTNFETNSEDYYNSATLLAFKSTGKYLIVSFSDTPDKLSFDMEAHNEWKNNNNHIYVYESTGNNEFGNPIRDFDNQFLTTAEAINSGEIQLHETTRQIKIEYVKQSQNVGIDNLIITKKTATGITEKHYDEPIIYTTFGTLYVANSSAGATIRIFNSTGQLLSQKVATSDTYSILLPAEKFLIVLITDTNGTTTSTKIMNQ